MWVGVRFLPFSETFRGIAESRAASRTEAPRVCKVLPQAEAQGRTIIASDVSVRMLAIAERRLRVYKSDVSLKLQYWKQALDEKYN